MATEETRPTVVGLYGIPGCGKSFLLKQLAQELGKEKFTFYEGSEVIAGLVPGGLGAFIKMDKGKKEDWRRLAIDHVRNSSLSNGRVAVVAGHIMFWDEGEEKGEPVYTDRDLNTYTHIIYLDTPAELAFQRRCNDTGRNRPSYSAQHLGRWQSEEKRVLRELCYQYQILFSTAVHSATLLSRVAMLLRDFSLHSDDLNLSSVESALDEIVGARSGKLHTMLVLDADRTLSPNDSGKLFWDLVSKSRHMDGEDPLKTLFSSPMGYSYSAFRQATLLYEDLADDLEFDRLCEKVAGSVQMYPEFASLLQRSTEKDHVGAVVVTCGLRRVWEKVLEREGLFGKIKIIGGGRLDDKVVVTAAAKAAVVSRLKHKHKTYTVAFGDSVLDLPMLHQADEAIVVVGDKATRSKIMDKALLDAIENGGLSARQVLLPAHVTPRANNTILPILELTDPGFIESLTRSRPQMLPKILHATESSAAKVLMTPMRDSGIAGPALREAHRRVGWYLAIELLTKVIGVEEHTIPHVQGNNTTGYRLQNEKSTLIVALMRGGEPMALGVNDAFPSAIFLHAKCPDDIKPVHALQQHSIILVDSVINSGKTIVQFLQHIRKINPSVPVVVVAGVVQAGSLAEGSLAELMECRSNFSIVALRISENKYTGRGTTDTGNRLFNTTYIP
ncbi:hypothetical protein TWF481_001528 [Arthrobotrys musiformis]|uniref:AAA+ ATPase domain-containing protein n=1 Tax=Arthrobotrys musiformis TaxID=47236 RepID=A0AAV9WQU1_9PEZI